MYWLGPQHGFWALTAAARRRTQSTANFIVLERVKIVSMITSFPAMNSVMNRVVQTKGWGRLSDPGLTLHPPPPPRKTKSCPFSRSGVKWGHLFFGLSAKNGDGAASMKGHNHTGLLQSWEHCIHREVTFRSRQAIMPETQEARR